MSILRTILSNIKNIKRAKKLREMGAEELLKLNDDMFYDAMLCIINDTIVDLKHEKYTDEQITLYTLMNFEAEVNNGGLCQFLVNSSRECAPYVSGALKEIGALEIKNLFDEFVLKNSIDLNDLFEIHSIEEYNTLEEKYDFDSFDDKFYEHEEFTIQVLTYARENINKIL